MRLVGSLIFLLVMYGSALPLAAYSVFRRRAGAAALIPIARLWARIVLWALRVFCGITVEARGVGAPPTGPALVASQHQSALDIFAMLVLLPRPTFVLKRELTRIPLFGPSLLAAGMIAVDRTGGAASLRRMVAAARGAIGQGRQIVIFPEGTRVPAGARGTIQPGIVALARALEMPVTPVTTDSGRRWGRAAFLKTPGAAAYTVQPVLAAGLSRGDLAGRLEALYYGGEASRSGAKDAGIRRED